MTLILNILLIVIFASISILHFYWVFGGKKGLDKALPTNTNGKRIMNPSKITTAIVAVGLFYFSFYYFLNLNVFKIALPEILLKYTGWVIPSIFVLRAIGDFEYVGFFKKIKTSEFAKFDTTYFSPLSLIIGFLGFLLQILF